MAMTTTEMPMRASEIRKGDEMLLGERFVGVVTNAAPSLFGVSVEYRGADTQERRTITLPADQDVHPIDGYEGRFFVRPDEEEHFDCGRTDCDGGCYERTVDQFDRGQM